MAGGASSHPGCSRRIIIPMRALLLGVLAIAANACAATPGSAWSIDAGIYGTTRHFGPVGFLCGVGYDLRYHGADPIDHLDVTVRYPAAARITGLGPAGPDGRRRPFLPATGAGSLADAARLGHASGTLGAVCPNGPADLDSLRGTVVRVDWHTVAGDREQEFRIDAVRGDLTVYAGESSTDGQVRIEWQAH